MEGLGASSYGEGFADVYDDWYADVSDLDGTVETINALAAGTPVLELGIGTGRVALPLARRGVEVHGVDASPAMLDRLRAKPGGAALPVVVGDFADVPAQVHGGFGVIFVAYNTLFNLPSSEAQRRCFANAAQRLRPGGVFVVEAFVPSPEPDGPTGTVTPSVVGATEVVLHVTRRHPATQTVEGSTVSITEEGIRLRPWHIRYAWPPELDDMARSAGLSLERRHAGWRGETFTTASPRHVSVYRRGA